MPSLMEKKEKKCHGSLMTGEFYFSLGWPLQPLLLCGRKTCVLSHFDLSPNWNFFVILKMLIILQCDLNRSLSKEKTVV